MSLQNSIIILIHRLQSIKMNYITFLSMHEYIQCKMWGIKHSTGGKDIIAAQIADLNITEPKNLEEQALSLVGKDVYEKLIKGYT